MAPRAESPFYLHQNLTKQLSSLERTSSATIQPEPMFAEEMPSKRSLVMDDYDERHLRCGVCATLKCVHHERVQALNFSVLRGEPLYKLSPDASGRRCYERPVDSMATQTLHYSHLLGHTLKLRVSIRL